MIQIVVLVHISIEEVLKHTPPLENIQTSFLAKTFLSQKWPNSAF